MPALFGGDAPSKLENVVNPVNFAAKNSLLTLKLTLEPLSAKNSYFNPF
jgi:hypothetical protein